MHSVCSHIDSTWYLAASFLITTLIIFYLQPLGSLIVRSIVVSDLSDLVVLLVLALRVGWWLIAVHLLVLRDNLFDPGLQELVIS